MNHFLNFRRHLLVCVLVCMGLAKLKAQPGDFVIGVFGYHAMQNSLPYCFGPVETAQTTIQGTSYATSTLNVVSEDGFNVVHSYEPNIYSCEEGVRSTLKLANANNMQVYLGHQRNYYTPTVTQQFAPPYYDYNGTGTTTFNTPYCSSLPSDVCPVLYSEYIDNLNGSTVPDRTRQNVNQFISNVYSDPTVSDYIWGHHLVEEGAYPHEFSYDPNCEPGSEIIEELSPLALVEAMNYFSANVPANQRLGVMEAHHGKAIHGFSNDPIPGDQPLSQDNYDPQFFIQSLFYHRQQGVYLEGTYTGIDPSEWYLHKDAALTTTSDRHYLGYLRSLEYAHQFVDEVHQVINTTKDDNTFMVSSQSGDLINGDWLWAQSYYSIIHGANGVWMWWLPGAYNSVEKTQTIGSSPAYYKHHFWQWSPDPRRFERQYFPALYKDFMGPLANELRYLREQGFLDSDPNTIVATKTNQADACGVVPASDTYLVPALTDPVWGLTSAQQSAACNSGVSASCELAQESHGIRYTVRSNGEEAIMIIANVTGVPIFDLEFDLSGISNPAVQTANKVDVLFQDTWPSKGYVQAQINAETYKTNRHQVTDWSDPNGVVKISDYFATDRKLSLSFGPTDVHVLRFKPTPVPNTACELDWEKTWSNQGNGTIGTWEISPNDHFTAGDFDGDGDQELFCASSNANALQMAMLNYVNGEWEMVWTNFFVSHPLHNYKKRILAGNFDADPEFELLGIGDTDVAFFDYTGGNWVKVWGSDTDPNPLGMHHYRDMLQAGNFDGGNKWELVGKHAIYGTFMTIFPDLDVVPFSPNFWYRVPGDHSIAGDATSYVPVDINGEGKDELVRMGPWAITYDYRTSWDDWRWTSSNNGGNFACWPYSYPGSFTSLGNGTVLAGDLDMTDLLGGNVIPKDELLIITNTGTGIKAVTMDYDFGLGNWACNCVMNNFLGDWPLADPANGSHTQYLLVQPELGQPEQVLAMRQQGCNFVASQYKSLNGDKKISQNGSGSELDVPGLKLYPNPTAGRFTLERSLSVGSAEIDIFHMNGKKVFSTTLEAQQFHKELNLSEVTSGMYLVRMRCAGFPDATQKLILE